MLIIESHDLCTALNQDDTFKPEYVSLSYSTVTGNFAVTSRDFMKFSRNIELF